MKLLRRNPTTGNFQEVDVNVSGNPSANNGVMFDTSNLVLGQAVGAANDPAKLLSARELPTDGNEFSFVERKANAILLVRLTGRTGDGTTKGILEFTNGETYATAPNGIMQLAYMTDKTLRFWGKDGVNGWKNSLTVEPDGDIVVQKSIYIRQDGQPGTSLYEIRQDPGTGQTDVLNLKRTGTSSAGGADPSYTLFEIEAPTRTNSTDPQEATISLSRKWNTRNEFLDLFNNGYPSAPISLDMGLRVQRRGSGAVLRDFVIQYASDLNTVVDAIRITPLTVSVPGAVTDGEIRFSAPFRPVLRGTQFLQWNDLDNTHWARIAAPDAITTNYILKLPVDIGLAGQTISHNGNGNLLWTWNGESTPRYITAAATASVTDRTILCNFGSTQALTLFTAIGNAGKRLSIKRIAGTGAITVTPVGSQTIDGAATFSLSNTDAITIQSDGANWFIIESNIITSGGGGTTYTESSTSTLAAPTFTGTGPGGTVTRLYRWSRVGSITTFEFYITGTTAGSAITDMTFALPSNVPVPAEFQAANNAQFAGVVHFVTNAGAISASGRMVLQRTGTNAWSVVCSTGSSNARFIQGSITYRSTVGTGSLDP